MTSRVVMNSFIWGFHVGNFVSHSFLKESFAEHSVLDWKFGLWVVPFCFVSFNFSTLKASYHLILSQPFSFLLRSRLLVDGNSFLGIFMP